ncbi:hypothetical protein ACOSP7_004894 [Xanthoceras sorbifolium]
MKYKRKHMNLENVIVHIRIEEKNRQRDKIDKAKEITSNANVVENYVQVPQNNKKQQNFKSFHKKVMNNKNPNFNPSFKKKGRCFVCGKPGHYAQQCRYKMGDKNPSKVNLVERDDVIVVVVVSEVNIVDAQKKDWVIDSGATKHICGDMNYFYNYTSVKKEGEESVYLGDSRSTPVIGKGKILLKLTYGKILSLNNVLHVPTIRYNLVSVYLLGKASLKISFE